jgi:hypothetical protein
VDGGDLGEALRVVRSAVAGRSSRRTRLRAALLPPSVLARWRQRVTVGGTSAIAAAGRSWEGVVRVLSPRRLLAGRSGR